MAANTPLIPPSSVTHAVPMEAGFHQTQRETSSISPATVNKAHAFGKDFFRPRTSLSMVLCRSLEKHSHVFEQIQRDKDARSKDLKHTIHKTYAEISESITWQKYGALALGCLGGAAQMASPFFSGGASAGLKALGENVFPATQRFADASSQSTQNLLQGRRSEAESRRERENNSASSEGNAQQAFIQAIKDRTESEKQEGLR